MAKNKASDFTRFFRPIIEALGDKGGSGRTSEIIDRAIEILCLSEDEQNLVLAGGGSKVRNQAHWARLYLVKASILDSSARGVWNLSEEGARLDPETNGTAAVFIGVMAILLRSVLRGLGHAVWSVGRAVSDDA